ncbi:hypothetical protein FQA39_LY09762 [Lamprigera yunnana]|nr:hypothetical protein FQA39_LY09762 [Lamprigera yunnana]
MRNSTAGQLRQARRTPRKNILPAKLWPTDSKSNQGDKEKSVSRSNKPSLNEDIIFPDELVNTQLRFLSNVDYSANGKGINCVQDVCDDAKDYPYQRIQEIMDKIDVYKSLFGYLEGTIVDIPNRFKPAGEEGSESLCAATIHTKYPKTMKTENQTERFVINVPDHMQGMVFETCVENAKCKYATLFPNGVTSQCSQRYSKRRLMALGEDGNPVIDTFVVPSCCLCTITKRK